MRDSVLLIGGGGTLGLYTAKNLLSEGYSVDIITLDHQTSDRDDLRFFTMNADCENIRRFLLSHSYRGIVNFIHYPLLEEYKAIHPLLSSACEHLIFLSSYRVYADSEEPLTEESPTLLHTSKDAVFLRDLTYYPLAKMQAEDWLRHDSGTDNWTAVRPVISFSDRRFDLVTRSGNYLPECAKIGKTVTLPSAARHLHAGLDWAGNSGKLIASLLFRQKTFRESYTVSSAQNPTWEEVAAYYTEQTGVTVEWIDTQKYLEENHKADPYILLYDRLFDRVIDNRKILSATGLTKNDFVPIREGIRTELEKYMRTHQG